MLPPDFHAPGSAIRSICSEAVTKLSADFRERITNQLRPTAISALDSAVEADHPICIWSILVEVAVARLALAQLLLSPQPEQFSSGARSKDSHDEQPSRLRRHGPHVEYRNVTQDIVRAIFQW